MEKHHRAKCCKGLGGRLLFHKFLQNFRFISLAKFSVVHKPLNTTLKVRFPPVRLLPERRFVALSDRWLCLLDNIAIVDGASKLSRPSTVGK